MGSFKIVFKPEVSKIEEYVTEVSIPQNFRTFQSLETYLLQEFGNLVEFPKCKKFTTGTLSGTPFAETFSGSLSRNNCQLDISHFFLPEKIGNTILTMKPLRVELLANNAIVGEISKEFPRTEKKHTKDNLSKDISYFPYCLAVGLSNIWKDNVDLIRIVFNIQVQESQAEFVENSQSKGIEMLDKDIFGTIKKEMIKFHNSKDFSDATIRCGTKVIFVHRFALSLASPVFRIMFVTEMKEKKNGEVIIEDIESNILEHLIKWIYTGNVEVIELQDQMDLFKAAHKYQVETLKNWCSAQIFAQISPNNALELYEFGESYEEALKDKALQIIKANKSKVFSDPDSKEFIKRYPELVMELLNL